MLQQLSPDQQKVLAAKELLARRRGRKSIKDFVLYTYPDYIVGQHHELLFQTLDDAIALKKKRIMIFMPPRHGKSLVVSRRLPAYYLGRNPDKRVVIASYEADLAVEFGRDVRNLVNDDPHFTALFPVVTVTEDSKAAGRWNTPQGGGFKAVGINSGLTGRGGDLTIIDDPVKDRAQADSVVFRERIKAWYRSTFYTRLQEDSIVIICMTRWHHDDLAGWLLTADGEDEEFKENWYVINLQGLAREGDVFKRKYDEALWPEKFSEPYLKKVRRTIGPAEFESLYQGNPTIQEGEMFKKEDFRFWNRNTLPNEFDEEIISIDPNLKETKAGSKAAVHHWGRSGPNFYLLDRIAGRWRFSDALANIRNFCLTRPMVGTKLFEDTAAGPALMDVLKKEIGGIEPAKPRGKSKEIRAKAIQPYHVGHNIFLPEQSPDFPWVNEFIQNCSQFPHSAEIDDVDTMTQAINWWIEQGGQYEIGWTTGRTGVDDLTTVPDEDLEKVALEKHGDMTISRVLLSR